MVPADTVVRYREPKRTVVVEPRVVSLRAAARYAGVSTWTIRRWVKSGLLPVVRYPDGAGGELSGLRFDRVDVDALIEGSKPAGRPA